MTSYPGRLEQGGTHPQRSQRCQPRESTGAPTAVAREHLQNGVAANLVYGDTCGDAPSLAESHLGRDASGTAGSVEGTNEGMVGDSGRGTGVLLRWDPVHAECFFRPGRM